MSAKFLMSLLPLALIPLLGGCATAGNHDSYSPANRYYSGDAAGYDYQQAELDALLAPIALYPDTLLSHILIASTYPQEVLDAHEFARSRSSLTGDAMVQAASKRGWDPSVTALTAFPDVLARMAEDMAWTQALGDAFLDSEPTVMASVQRLRNRAYDEGNLAGAEQVRVVRENSVVVIEPRHSTIYAPYYDSRVVYGDWWWPEYPPTYWHSPGRIGMGSHFYWGAGTSLSSGFYFSSFNWHRRNLMVIDRPHWQRYHSHPAIITHPHARPWRHNPSHRRGYGYREGPAFDRFGAHQSRPALPRRDPAFNHRDRHDRDQRPQRFGPQRDAINNRAPDNRPTGLPLRPPRIDTINNGRPSGNVRVNDNASNAEQRLRDRAIRDNRYPEGYRQPREGNFERGSRTDSERTRRFDDNQRPDRTLDDNRQRIINTSSRELGNTRPQVAPTAPQSERARQYLQQQESKRQWRESQSQPAHVNPALPNRDGQVRDRMIREQQNRNGATAPRIERAPSDGQVRERPARVDNSQRQIREPRQVIRESPQSAVRQQRPEGNFSRPQFREDRGGGNSRGGGDRPQRGNDR